MRTLSKFITLLLCLELIVAPIAPSLSFLGQKAYAQQNCGAGLQYDATLNRCLTKAQTANVLNATMNCKQGDVECYRTNAQTAFQDKVNAGEAPERKGNINKYLSSAMNAAAIAGPVTLAVMGMSREKSGCSSSSYYAMIAAALAVVIGDNLANTQHKKRLTEIKEDWGKIVNPEQANGDKDKVREANIDAQSEAFEMLARAELSLASAAEMKKNFFLVASIAYGVAAAMSAMEILKNRSLKGTAIANAATATSLMAALPNTAAKISSDAKALAVASAAHEAAEATATGEAGAPAAVAKATVTMDKLNIAMTAMKSTIAPATTEATAMAASTMGTGAAAAAAAATAVSTAAASTNAWVLHTKTVTCVPVKAEVVNFNHNPDSLFVQYTSGRSMDIRQELQAFHNLKSSEDLVSFIMNQKELNGEIESPIEEYKSYKESFFGYEDQEIFELFKATSIAVINQLSPFPEVHAIEEELRDERLAEEGFGGGGGGRGARSQRASSEVNTNAAKAYKEDEARGIDYLGLGIGLGAGYLLAKSKVGGWLIQSKGRLIFSGVMGGLTLLMSNHAGKQAEASKERARLLREMKKEFNVAAGGVYACGSEDRNNPGKPTCYCYTSENARNPNRGNSQVCQNLWAGKSLNATNYLAGGKTNSKICISNQNQADPTCACKQTGTCMKVGVNGISGFNPGTMSVLSSSLAPLNGIANGSIDGATVNGASLENAAARIRKLNDQLDKKGLGLKNRKALEDKLTRDLANAASSLPAGSLLGGSSGSNLPSNPGDAARMLEKELENNNTPTGIGGGGNFLAAPLNAQPEPGFEFGMTQDQLAAQENQIAEVMQQDLDYGGNDINQGSNANIFDVLSNRYQRSGMRRLFDEEGKTKADKPSKTDIIQ